MKNLSLVCGHGTTGSTAAQQAAPNNPSSPMPLDLQSIIRNLRVRCPLPVLLKRMDLAKHAKPLCRSPFREDTKPSWGIFQRDGRWFWKDFGTDESGDEIDFIVTARELQDKKHARTLAVAYWNRVAEGTAAPETPDRPVQPTPRSKPDCTGFQAGSPEQIARLAALRDISAGALELASRSGILVFGLHSGHEVFGVTDASGNALEVRRLDGQPFPANGMVGERKSHSIKASCKSWPVGLANLGERKTVLLVEGLPDLLAAFEVILTEDAQQWAAPVGMLSASARIDADALPLFAGKRVRVVPHLDSAGEKGVEKWIGQLSSAGATVDVVRLAGSPKPDGSTIKDLNDYLSVYRAEKAAGLPDWRLL
jgi:hypothetical protein